jgi:hypothetical protein
MRKYTIDFLNLKYEKYDLKIEFTEWGVDTF